MNWTDEDLDRALLDLRDDPLPDGTLETVRARVLDQLAARPKPWRWAWLPALAAALVLVMVLEVPHSQPVVEPPPLLAKAPAAPPLERAPQPAPGPPKLAQVARLEPQETQFVKLVTDDPDVVILWAVDSKGESR